MPTKNNRSNLNPLIQALVFDSQKGLIIAANTDWLVIRASVFRNLLRGIDFLRGVDSGFALEVIGKNVGKATMIEFIKQGYKPVEIPTILELLINLGGWGKVQLKTDKTKKSGYFAFENRMVAEDAKLREAHRHFIKGFLEGLTERLMANAIWVEKAPNADTDLVCEFYLHSISK